MILFGIWLPYGLFAVLAGLYIFRYFAWELLVLALGIDIYFSVDALPYYLLTVAGLLLLIEVIRPKLFIR